MKDEGLFSDINITPLTDIIMVLLIIFMMTAAAFSEMGFDINLPHASHADPVGKKQVEIYVDRTSQVFMEGCNIKIQNLGDILRGFAVRNYKTLIIKADESVAYGKVIEVMDRARESGFSDIALAVVRK